MSTTTETSADHQQQEQEQLSTLTKENEELRLHLKMMHTALEQVLSYISTWQSNESECNRKTLASLSVCMNRIYATPRQTEKTERQFDVENRFQQETQTRRSQSVTYRC